MSRTIVLEAAWMVPALRLATPRRAVGPPRVEPDNVSRAGDRHL
jgi:hypothetical protein